MKSHRFMTLPVALLVFILCSTLAMSAAQPSAKPASIPSILGAPNILSELPQAMPRGGAKIEIPHRTGFTAKQYQELKQRALTNALENMPALAPQGGDIDQIQHLLDTPAASKTFLPPNAIDESCSGFIPSDGALAANPTYVVEVENACITVLNPNTGVPFTGFPKALGSFMGTSSFTGDPRALYDPNNNRFIVAAEDFNSNTYALAVSQTGNPTGLWNHYFFNMGGPCNNGGDFPMVGQTMQEDGDQKGAIYIGWNVFDCNGNFLTNFIFAVSKSKAYAGQSLGNVSGFTNLSVGPIVNTVQPANVMTKTDRVRTEFLANSFDFNFGGGACVSGCNGVTVWAFSHGIPKVGGKGQALTGIVIGTANNYFLSPHAGQPGCSVGTNFCGLDTGTPAFSGEVTYSSGTLYASLNDSRGVLEFEITPFLDDNPNITAAVMRNEICFACGGIGAGGSAYYGVMAPDSEGNFTMVYSFSDANNFPTSAYLTNRVTQALHTVHDSGFILAGGQAFYEQLDQFGRNRWGDYNAVSFSGKVPNSSWFSAEFSESNGNWGKSIGLNGYTATTQP